jgi:AGZA family xanthine/uracil permease-like MFS transporter
MVGLFMMRNVVHIDFKNIEIAVPAFLIIILIALTYSISTGLAFGFVFYVLIQIVMGKGKSISPVLWVIFGLSVLNLAIHTLGLEVL